MPKQTRIYTRTGDDGTTGLYSGARVAKTDPRVEAYGTVDELSSAIGVARAVLCHPERSAEGAKSKDRIDAWLAWVQDKLFDMGAELATPSGSKRAVPVISDADVTVLERSIDEFDAALPPLDQFIHAGGSFLGALLHLARTICRRAERRVLALHERDHSLDPLTLRYLNRLGDALFVWARYVNKEAGTPEHIWRKSASAP
jgi:cob(I)alamin adenosyltransferase